MQQTTGQEKSKEQIAEDLKKYITLNVRLFKLELLEKLSLILTMIFVIIIGSGLILIALGYASLAFIVWTKALWGSFMPGILIIVGVAISAFILLVLLRQTLFINPFISFLSSILLSNDDNEDEEAL